MTIERFKQMKKADGFIVSHFSPLSVFPTPVKTLTNASTNLAYSYANKTLVIREERHVANTISVFAKDLVDFIMLSKVLDGALVVFRKEEELDTYIELLQERGFGIHFKVKTSDGFGDYVTIEENRLVKTQLENYTGEIFTVGQVSNCFEDVIPF